MSLKCACIIFFLSASCFSWFSISIFLNLCVESCENLGSLCAQSPVMTGW